MQTDIRKELNIKLVGYRLNAMRVPQVKAMIYLAGANLIDRGDYGALYEVIDDVVQRAREAEGREFQLKMRDSI